MKQFFVILKRLKSTFAKNCSAAAYAQILHENFLKSVWRQGQNLKQKNFFPYPPSGS